ncbi:MAG: hypothetical protein IJ581_03650 [Paludibacteraceae bacterium]|nr:hypothetical protein [Paludibacteraceae bacterium]
MRKLFFLPLVLCAALTLNAEVIDVNLNAAAEMAFTGCSATPSVADGVLTVQYSAGGWEWAGVEFPVNNLTQVPTISYEYCGDGAPGFADGIVLFVYLRDIDGNRWIQTDYWPNIQNTEWQSEIITPDGALDWDAPAYAIGEKAFTRLGFIVNPGAAASGSFRLRNISLTILGEGEERPVTDNPDSLMYNGVILPHNTDFTRAQCGSLSASLHFDEVSGIACSRVTPGYIWMESDNFGTHIIATDETGQQKAQQVNLNTGNGVRDWDWEDLCGGVYNGTDYLFIGAFGDNNEDDDFYSILYFEEPAITGSDITITPSQIHYVYPDGRSHNNEALMYDNRDQVLYIITKVYYNVCQVFSLPFRTDYGDETQTLTYVCDLGVRSDIGINAKNRQCRGFHLVTAADISPDGNYILIKNHNNIEAAYSWILYWERIGDESVAETLLRQPQVIDCYEYEWQGEALCWLNDDVFYSTSDSDGEPPVYKYTRQHPQAVPATDADNRSAARKILCNGRLRILRNGHTYTITGHPLPAENF